MYECEWLIKYYSTLRINFFVVNIETFLQNKYSNFNVYEFYQLNHMIAIIFVQIFDTIMGLLLNAPFEILVQFSVRFSGFI